MVRGCGLGHHIDDYHVWIREDQLVLSWIVASVSEGILPQLVGAETAQTAWNKLVAAYASGSKPQIRELKTQLHTLQRDNSSIESYVQKAKEIVDKLAALQHPVPNDDLVEFVLAGLGPAYRPFTRSLESRQEDISFDALYGLLLNEERQLKRDETLNVIAPTAQFTQSSIAPSRGCGRGRGPYARVCPSPKTSNGTRVFGRPVSNLANTQTPPTQNWLMDSGTTHHLTSDLENLGIDSEYQGPEEVTLGNGSKLPISHTGASSIVASDKKFKLEDILHVPSATQNLISISSFTKSNNVSVEFFPNHFLIKDLATRVKLKGTDCD
ncbi:PREDICTED: uncharacterized protein LOC109217567 [Nicotiana attenuata]|uniref:uncharacterized protein LOC109217567 n=1 Tax=Nicotiana attenuata TaxID=49451 RepID=UPI0009055E76|nr:PREDICTED: uncharacterized protein LOC109217567 [Nicotiana attenuata]